MKQQTKVPVNGPARARWIRRTAVADYRVCVCTLYLFSERSALLPHLKFSGPQAQPAGDKAEFIEKVRRALYLGKIVSYAQGFSQLRAASEEYNWDLNYGEIAKIFRAGCIIRAQFLQKITDAYAENPQIANLLLAPYLKQIADDYQQALRDVVAYAVQNGIPVPTFAAAVAYYDSYRAAVLPGEP